MGRPKVHLAAEKKLTPPPARACNTARGLRRAGVGLLLLAAVTSGMLMSHHFGTRLPGCGPGLGCDELQREWGYIPGIRWPIAFVGFAYFLAMTVGMGLSGWWRRNPLSAIACMGGVASLGFVGLMINLEKLCIYCAVTHGFNLAFVAVMWMVIRLEGRAISEQGASKMQSSVRPGRAYLVFMSAFAAVFAVTSGALAIANEIHRRESARRAEADREASAAAIIKKGNEVASEQPVDRWGSAGFTGRYRKGPAEAALRVVVLTDYQCPDCRRVEDEIEQVFKSRSDMSLSVKHFPMCLDCNKYAGRTLHANACWAARAAEAAGILGGDEAFFKMHDWLFEKKGYFIRTEDLEPGIAATGLDPAGFRAVMGSPQTLKNVQADVEDGMALGLFSTPMIFINGVEFKGWQVPGAFKRTVDQVAATKPAAKTAAADRPVLAAQRYVNDWKESPQSARPEDKVERWMGVKTGDAPANGEKLVEIIVYGDYQEENTIKLNADILEAMRGRTNVRYVWRHYPVDPSCNTALPANVPAASVHPLACMAAKAAEAAGVLGGNEAYWKMHQWLIDNWQSVSEEGIRKAAKDFGWDVDKYVAMFPTPNVSEAIVEDCRAAKMVGLSRIPYVIVNNRVVPRVLKDGDNVMKRIVEEAGRK